MGFFIAAAGLTGSAAAEPVKLLAFGDSLTAGYGLPPDQGFVPQLQAWLEAHGTAVVVQNGGVSGDTSSGGLSRINWALGDGAQAMILTLGGNDLLRGIAPEVTRDNLDAILARTDAERIPVLLVPMVAPGNYGNDYKIAFDAIYADLAARHRALLARPFLSAILDQPDRATALARYVQDDGLHPTAEGVALIVDRIGPQVQELLAKVK